MSTLLGIGLGAAGGLVQEARAGKQHRRQKELMDIQNQNQRGLNEQGHQMNKDMWDYSNYGNQVKHMKNAGLNVGLMYGMGGGGGSTAGSQSGGSAAGGSAAAPMDIGNALQAGLMKAQIDNINADTNLKKGDTDLKGQQGQGILQQIEESKKKMLEIASEIKLNEAKGVTEGTIQKLNEATEKLNEKKVAEIGQRMEVTELEISEMKKLGVTNVTPDGAKMIKYYAEEMQMDVKEVILLIGASNAMGTIANIAKVLK